MPNPLKENSNWLAVRERALVPAGRRVRAWRSWIVENDPVYVAARRPGAPEKVAASVTLALIIGIILFLAFFDWNLMRGPIGRWASARYDRQIELNGDLDVRLLSWTPSIQVRDLRVGGPDWARDRDTLRIDDLQASMRLRALFAGRIEMPLVAITRPQAVLISTADGRRSWALNPDRPDSGEGLKLPPINRLIIRDGRLSLDEQRRKIRLEAVVAAREGSDGDAGFHLDGRGTINGTPLTLSVRGGPFINIRRDRPYGFQATLAGVGSRLVANGAITRPFDLGRFRSTLSLEGRDLADVYLLTGVTALALCIVAYRLTTMVGVSFPSHTAESLNRAYETGQTAAKNSRNKLDDLIVLLGDPLVKKLLKTVKEREKVRAETPDVTGAVGCRASV